MNPRFDTLAIARDLRQHGFTQDQAEAVADAVNQAAGLPDLTVLATKDDLAALATKDELRAAIADVRSVITGSQNDILKWIIGLVVSSWLVNVGTMLALVRLTGH
jgi:hypothetical protein